MRAARLRTRAREAVAAKGPNNLDQLIERAILTDNALLTLSEALSALAGISRRMTAAVSMGASSASFTRPGATRPCARFAVS